MGSLTGHGKPFTYQLYTTSGDHDTNSEVHGTQIMFLENSSYQCNFDGQVLDHGSRLYSAILVAVVIQKAAGGA